MRLVIISFVLILVGCSKTPVQESTSESVDYYGQIRNAKREGLVMLAASSHQQTTDYTCGPSAVLSLLRFYGLEGDEMSIANEMGTNDEVGTTPEQMTDWLNKNNFTATYHRDGSLEDLRANLEKGMPTLVEWSDWGGHWVMVVGYDTRNTEKLSDDVIFFADPYDQHDDTEDGMTLYNAERFFYNWYDESLFDELIKGIYVTAVPKK
jgi:hypothetical protein